ncbi:MAG: hypothetical protein AB3N64_12570 [Puniceicoccaceae bacterium]
MADDATDQTPPADKDDLDLSSLSSLSLGPDWLSGKKSATRIPKGDHDENRRGSKGPPRDRRGGMDRRSDRGSRGDRPTRGPRGHRPARGERRERRERPVHHEPFAPTVAVDFYPEEEPFKVLSQAIRNSCRTFELFEIARLILDKPDRFVCVVRDPEQKEGEAARLHASVPDGLPFASEEEALAHVFRHYMDEFFNVETVEVDPPAGSFQMVHKCGMTGELLGPPNYHRYQSICREHHAARLSHVPYDRFEQKIESSREEEDIEAWLTQMRTQTRYSVKDNPEQVFTNREDARLYLFTEAKEKLVRPAYSARFSGKSLALLNPGDKIRRSVEYLLEGQKRFPLETANHLRGRLRRMHFAVYKRGSKGVSFVCAVKRHFRKPDEVLADNLQKLIDFLEAHPNFPAKNLPMAYLGGETAKQKPAADEAAKEESKPEDAEQSEEKETTSPAEPAPPEESLDPAALKQLKTDLHYLVSQGYVIEYSDGRLFVPPIREDEIRHMEKQKAAAVAEKEKAEAVSEDPAVGTDSSPEQEPEAAQPADEPEDVPGEDADSAEPAEPSAAAEPVEEPGPEPVEAADAVDTEKGESKPAGSDSESPEEAETTTSEKEGVPKSDTTPPKS